MPRKALKGQQNHYYFRYTGVPLTFLLDVPLAFTVTLWNLVNPMLRTSLPTAGTL
jgi:hypothetical protein